MNSSSKARIVSALDKLISDGVRLECGYCTHCFITTNEVFTTAEYVYCPKCGGNSCTRIRKNS